MRELCLVVLFFSLGLWSAEALTRAEHDAIAKRDYQEWEDMYTKLINDIIKDPQHQNQIEMPMSTDEDELTPVYDIPFECEVELSEEHPTSVHKLRPSDIQIVAALGDSITAGFGLRAQILPAVIMENRGEVWCAGSDRELRHKVITLPNILKMFNPNVQGSSICNRYPGHPYMNWFNVAVGGARSTHMVPQAWNLVDRLRTDQNIDFFNDWKLITILIGGNDLCRACWDPEYAPPRYAKKIRDAIDIMQDHIPNAMVNLVAMLDVTVVASVNHSAWCNGIHQGACPCALGEEAETTGRYTVEYYEELRKIVDTGRWDQWDDFTVVLQPMMRDLYPDVLMRGGELPQDYFAPDCFHPGLRGHQELAVLLWTGMMTPVGEKPFKFFPEDLVDGYRCPTKEHPYIFTKQNSMPEKPVTAAGDKAGIKVVLLIIMSVLSFGFHL